MNFWPFKRKSKEIDRVAPHAGSAFAAPKPAQPVPPSIPVYPPVDAGLAFIPPEEILKSQNDLIRRLRMLAGGTDENFDLYYRAVLLRLAGYVQLLPASRGETHMGAGGLFRLCLELGFYSLQSAGAVVFAGQEGVERRREMEPRWRYATFLAGLCAELYRPLSDMMVTDQHGNRWPKYMMSLTDWATESGIDRYFVRWTSPESKPVTTPSHPDVSVMMNAVISKQAYQYMEEGSPRIVPTMFAVATGTSHPTDSQTARIVDDRRKQIFKRDAAGRKELYGKLTVGAHLDPYLIDAIRQLYRSGDWKVNADKSRLWFTNEGMFAVWKSAAKDIQRLLNEKGVDGVPAEASTLAEMLAESRVIERFADKSPYTLIKPPGSDTEWLAVKFVNPLTILEDDEIVPLESKVIVAPAGAAAKAEGQKDKGNGKEATPAETAPVERAKSKAEKASKGVHPPTDPIDSNRDLGALSDQQPAPAVVADPPKDGIPVTPPETPVPAAPPPSQPPHAKEKATVAPATAAPATQPAGKSSDSAKPVVKTSASKADPDAAIEPATAQVSHADRVPERIRKALRADVAEVIGVMISDYQSGKFADQISDVPEGIAFEVQRVFSYGLPMERLVGTLYEAGWVHTPADRPSSKVIKTKMQSGRVASAVILKADAAKLLGFIPGDDE